MRWTSRLRRWGGRANIGVARGRQFALLQAVSPLGWRRPLAEQDLAWLQGNPLRVLSLSEEKARFA